MFSKLGYFIVKFIFILNLQQCFPAGVTVGKYKMINTSHTACCQWFLEKRGDLYSDFSIIILCLVLLLVSASQHYFLFLLIQSQPSDTTQLNQREQQCVPRNDEMTHSTHFGGQNIYRFIGENPEILKSEVKASCFNSEAFWRSSLMA